jgi:flagellar biosynthesis protein FlhG
MAVPAGNRINGDQAEALRRLVEPEARATTIAITSGKGGVGKTSIAVNLAIALAAREARVFLVDADLGLANADLLLGMPCRRNLAHVLSGACTLADVMVPGPAGLRLVPGASGLEQLANLSEFERHHLLAQLEKLERECDYLILDLGAGVGRNVIGLAAWADHVLVVTTPEPPALADAYATVKLLALHNRAADIEAVVNQAFSRAEARQTYERLAGVASRFLGLPLTFAGYVLSDEAVARAVRARQPFMISDPGCNASACVRALARHYCGAVPSRPEKRGFFRRVADLFQ